MVWWSVLRIARDLALYAFYMRRALPAIAGRFREQPVACTLWCAGWAATILACTALVGRNGLVDIGDWMPLAKMTVFAAATYVLNRRVLHLGRGASLLEGLLFLFTMRSCQMLYTECASPLLEALGGPLARAILSTPGETVCVALAGLALLAPLSPHPDTLCGEHLSPGYALILGFVFLDYMVFRLSYTGQDSSALAFATRAVECAGIYVLCFAIRWLVREDCEREQETRTRLTAERQYAALMNRERNDRLISTVYHDLKRVLAVMASEGGAPRDTGALQELERSVGSMRAVRYAGNPMLNMVLNQAADEARERGLHLDIDVNMGPHCPMDPYDAVAVFGNALSNALEAAALAGPAPAGWVRFEATEVQGTHVFRIANSCAPQADGAVASPLATHKAGAPSDHGLGYASMRHTVQRYGGHLDHSTENGVFTLLIMLPLPNQDPARNPAGAIDG